MSKLFGLFGKKKKNKNQISANLLDQNIEVISQLPESAKQQNLAPKFMIHDIDYSESDDSENWPQPRSLRNAKKQRLHEGSSFQKSPSDRISYVHGNEKQSLNTNRSSIGSKSHILNRYVVTQSKATNRTSEIENFTTDTKENSLIVQTEVPTQHATETSNPNGPGRYVVLRENNVQRRSRNLGEYVNNMPYRGNKSLDTMNDDRWELRGLNETVQNRLSLKNGEQTGRTIRQGRVSLLVPLTLDGQDKDKALDPMTRIASEGQPRKLSVVKPVAQGEHIRYSVLNSEDMKPIRQSVMNPMMRIEPNKQERYSSLQPIVINENARPGRVSVNRPLSRTGRFPLNSTQPVVYAVRRDTDENNQSPFLKRLFTRKRDGERQEGGIQVEQTVCSVPTVPTRGRTGSILQQSIKSLTSQKEESPVSRKNIRYSVDTDVFSAGVRQRAITPTTPGYVNMERGQGILVSELLNPITTIFVSDLKDPVPKDPYTRPRETNNWVRPRKYSLREVVTPNPPYKQSKRVKIAVAPVAAPTKMKSNSKQVRRNSRYESEDESSSYDDESSESIDYRAKYLRNRKPTRHRVYAATMPTVNLPDLIREVDDTSSIEGNTNLGTGNTLVQPSPNTNVLDSDTRERRQSKLIQPPNVRRISAVQQIDIEDAVDFLCNPPEDIVKKTI